MDAWILTKFDIPLFFSNLSTNLKFHQTMRRITAVLYEDLCTFTLIRP